MTGLTLPHGTVLAVPAPSDGLDGTVPAPLHGTGLAPLDGMVPAPLHGTGLAPLDGTLLAVLSPLHVVVIFFSSVQVLLVISVPHDHVVSEDGRVFHHSIWVERTDPTRFESLFDGVSTHGAAPGTSQDAADLPVCDSLSWVGIVVVADFAGPGLLQGTIDGKVEWLNHV